MPLKGSKSWVPVLLLVLVVAGWASATVVTKHLYLQKLITPFTVVVCRFTLASLFAFLIFGLDRRRRGSPPLPIVGTFRAYLLGGFLISTFIIGFNTALLYITATLGGLIFFGFTPVIMLLVGRFWLGTSFGMRQVVGVIISLLGIVIVLSGGNVEELVKAFSGNNLPLGITLMLISALGWGTYGLWGRKYSSRQPGTSLFSTGINQMLGVLPVWVLFFIFEPNGIANLSLEAWLSILYVGIIPSALGFALFYSLIPRLSLNQVATIQLFSPVFTEIFAIIFLAEPFSIALVVGTVVLLWGVRVCTR